MDITDRLILLSLDFKEKKEKAVQQSTMLLGYKVCMDPVLQKGKLCFVC